MITNSKTIIRQVVIEGKLKNIKFDQGSNNKKQGNKGTAKKL